MKHFIFVFIILFSLNVKGQSVGFGTRDTTKARLTVNGISGNNSGTLALFGTIGGLTINSGSKIGFNQHWRTGSTTGNAVSTGYGMELNFNRSAGDISLYRLGKVDSSMPFGPRQIIFGYDEATKSMNLIRSITGGRLDVCDQMYNKQNGNFNLLPLGAITIKVTGFTNSSATATVSNVASNGVDLVVGHSVTVSDGVGVNGYMHLKIDLNFLTKTWGNIIPIGGIGVDNAGKELQSNFVRFFRNADGSPDMLSVFVSTSGLSSGSNVLGTLLIYGLK
jgi:hypothetical protein